MNLLKKFLKKENGSISLFILVSILFFLTVVVSVGISLENKSVSMDKKLKTIKQSYEVNVGNEESIYDESLKEKTLLGSTILRTEAPQISVSGLNYADMDNDGIADGIIVADVSKDSSDTTDTYKGGNPWGAITSWGGFSYTKQSSGLREYSSNTNYKYINPDGTEVDGTLVTCINKSGIPRYYIISLADYDDIKLHSWYYSAYSYDGNNDGDTNDLEDRMYDYNDQTKIEFGQGKNNTNNMIIAWNEKKYGEQNGGSKLSDIWGIIQDKANEGWFVPSRAEWAAFASYLNTSNTSTDLYYYKNYGLNTVYWTSSQKNNSKVYTLDFNSSNSGVHEDIINDGIYVRLASTF